ncbi:MAG: hypothetical protein ACUZ8N_00455 [Candidatus Scalindua sp.]
MHILLSTFKGRGGLWIGDLPCLPTGRDLGFTIEGFPPNKPADRLAYRQAGKNLSIEELKN